MVSGEVPDAGHELPEEGLIEQLVDNAEDGAGGALIPDGDAAGAGEDLIGNDHRADGHLLGGGEGVHLLLSAAVEVSVDRGGVHDEDVDANVAEVAGDGGGVVGDEGLGAAVGGGGGAGEVASGGGGEGDEATHLLLDHLAGEVVGDGGGADGVALNVGADAVPRAVGDHAGEDVASVAEDELDVDVLGGVDNGLHVRGVGITEVDGDLAEADVLVLSLELGEGLGEVGVVAGGHDDVDALLGELLGEALTDAGGGAGDEGPLSVVLVLEVVGDLHADLLDDEHDSVGREGDDAEEAGDVGENPAKGAEDGHGGGFRCLSALVQLIVYFLVIF